MIKYRTAGLGTSIEEVEIDRETEASVWVDGRLFQKKSRYCQYWDTWQEAHQYLLVKAEKLLQSYRLRLEQAENGFERIKAMKAP